jgi:hypothetical protein
MNTTINTTMDTVTTSTADFIDFDLIKADLTDVLNYVKETKPENLDKEALKTLRDNLSQLETILTNAIGDKPKAEKKTAKKSTKKTTTKKVEVETFDNDEGKKFYDSLKVGDEFKYVMASGAIITAKKIETKSKTGLSAACEVVSGMEIAEGKTKKRFPKFSKIVKVQNVEKPVENTEKPVEETAKTDEVKQPIAEEIKQAASVETNFNDTEDDDDLLNFDINDLDKDFDIE